MESEEWRQHVLSVVSTPIEMHQPYNVRRFLDFMQYELAQREGSVLPATHNTLLTVSAQRELLPWYVKVRRLLWNSLAPAEYHFVDAIAQMESCLASAYHVREGVQSELEDERNQPFPAILHVQEPRTSGAQKSTAVVQNFAFANTSGKPISVFLPALDHRVSLASGNMSGEEFGELCQRVDSSADGEDPWILVFLPSTGDLESDMGYFFGEDATVGDAKGLLEKLATVGMSRSIDESFRLAGLHV